MHMQRETASSFVDTFSLFLFLKASLLNCSKTEHALVRAHTATASCVPPTRRLTHRLTMKCGDVHQVMRRKPAHGDAAHGRSKTWRACFCLNVNVFHYLSEHAEDIEWKQLSRAVAPTPQAAEFVVGELREEQTPSDGQWVLGHWVVFRAGTAVVTPLSEYRFSQLCLYGHKKMLWVLTIYARIRSEQAWISTLGGGFASVRNVPKAIEYAVKLFYCACLLHDEDLKVCCSLFALRPFPMLPPSISLPQSKSRLFVGWNMLFLGNKKRARAIFLDEIVDAKNRHDDVVCASPLFFRHTPPSSHTLAHRVSSEATAP